MPARNLPVSVNLEPTTGKAAESDSLRIRLATKADVEVLLDLSTTTFYQAFAQQNTTQDMTAYMSSAFTAEQLISELQDPATTFFLAYQDNQLAGYTKLRKGSPPKELKHSRSIEIHRLYVLQTMIGKKIGKALMETCLQTAQRETYEVVWLGVWEHNVRAINFYKQFGFDVFSSHLFKLGDDVQRDFLMKKELV